MKNRRNLIIAAVVIIVLAVGTIVVMNIDTQKTVRQAEKEESYTIFSSDASELAKVSVTAEGLNINAENKGKSDWTINGLESGEIDPSKAYSLAGTVSTITSKNKYENPQDLAQYGLDSPKVTVKITKKDGEERTLYIGDRSAVLGEYFIKLDNDNSIYTLYEYKVDTLLKPIEYYREFDRLNIEIDDITDIRIEREDENIEIKIKDKIDENTNNVWEMVSPYTSGANDDYIDNKILAAIENISLTEPADVKVAAPVTLKITIKPYDDETGKYSEPYTETLGIGEYENKSYAVYKGEAYQVPSESVEFVYDSAFNIVSKMQALVDISLVDSVAVAYGNEEHTIQIRQDNNKYSFKLDGKDTDAKVSQEIYRAIISLAADGVYSGQETGETLLKLSYKGKNSVDDTVVEIKKLDDINCAMEKNGKTEFTIKKSKIDEFLEVFKLYVEENK